MFSDHNYLNDFQYDHHYHNLNQSLIRVTRFLLFGTLEEAEWILPFILGHFNLKYKKINQVRKSKL